MLPYVANTTPASMVIKRKRTPGVPPAMTIGATVKVMKSVEFVGNEFAAAALCMVVSTVSAEVRKVRKQRASVLSVVRV